MYLLKWTVCQPVYFLENIRQVLENVSILRPEWSYYLPISLAIIISICCNFLILIAENCETFIAALRVAILTFKCSNMLRQNCIIAQLDVMMAPQYCQAQLQVLSPNYKSQLQVQNPSPKSKIQSPEERDWDWGWHYNPILQATTPPPHPPITFLTSHLKCPSSVRIRPSPNEFALNSKAWSYRIDSKSSYYSLLVFSCSTYHHKRGNYMNGMLNHFLSTLIWIPNKSCRKDLFN